MNNFLNCITHSLSVSKYIYIIIQICWLLTTSIARLFDSTKNRRFPVSMVSELETRWFRLFEEIRIQYTISFGSL